MCQRVSKGLSEHILTRLQADGLMILSNKASLVESILRDAKENSRDTDYFDLFTNTYIFTY